MKELLARLKENNIYLSLEEDNNLKLKFNHLHVADVLIEEIKSRKAEIIEYLKLTKTGKSAYDPLPRIRPEENYPLSSSQLRLWLLCQVGDGNKAYNITKTFVFNGPLNRDLLEKCFLTLIERHEILRTVFIETKTGEVRQAVTSPEEFAFELAYEDLQTDRDPEGAAGKILAKEQSTPFVLSRGPLLRTTLLQLDKDKYIFSCVMHHIISDGWSMSIMIRELFACYSSYSRNERNSLKPLRIHYKDYAAWQQQELKKESSQKHRQYWLEEFKISPPVRETPTDHPRLPVRSYNGGLVKTSIDKSTTTQLKSLLVKSEGTLFMGLLGAVNLLLYKYTGQRDITLGSPTAGREHPDLENQIGFYMNTVALRTRIDGAGSYKQLLATVKQLTLSANEHQMYPFGELVDELQLKRDMSRHALFDVMVILQNTDIGKKAGAYKHMADIEVSEYDPGEHTSSKFDLTFEFTEEEGAIHLALEYNSDLYNKETAERLGDNFSKLVKSVIKDPDVSLDNLEFLSGTDQQKFDNTFGLRNYWLDFFTFPKQALPFDKALPLTKQETRDKKLSLQIGPEATQKLRIFSEETGCGLELITLSAYIHLLQRVSDTEQVIIGLPANQLARFKSNEPIHHFSPAFLPLAVNLQVDTNVGDFMVQVKEQVARLSKYGNVTEQYIADVCGKEKTDSFYDTRFIFSDAAEPRDPEEQIAGASCWDLHVQASGEEIEITVNYASSLFTETEMDLIVHKYIEGLKDLPASKTIYDSLKPEEPLPDLPVIKTNSYKNPVDQFKAQVLRDPHKEALISKTASFTYGSLDEISDTFASALQAMYGIKTGDRIALLLPRNEWLVIGILGILKAGAAYVPLSFEFPELRKEYIMQNSSCKLLLDENALGELRKLISQNQLHFEPVDIHENSIANIYYTSGTTGQPKGVMVKHSNLCAFFSTMKDNFGIREDHRLIATTALAFDISGLELLGAFCNGLTVMLADDEKINDPEKLVEYIRENKPDVLQVTPSRLTQLLAVEANWEFLSILLVGGEALPVQLYHTLTTWKNVKTYNVYGPTETTIWSSAAEVSPGKDLSVGRALIGEEIILLDKWHRPTLKGMTGEIAIAGKGVTAGYINNNELTNEKFIQHPCLKSGTIYLTGDSGQWNNQGDLIFKGRKDGQIKINGRRVELQEIEVLLSQIKGIQLCAVVMTGEKDSRQIVAFYCSPSELSKDLINSELSKSLPAYMLPAQYVKLQEMPMSVNGKINRIALAAWKELSSVGMNSYSPPVTEHEKILVEAFEFVLGKKQLGTDHDFFLLGGDSIKSIQVISRIKKKGLKLELADILRYPRIRDLALRITINKSTGSQEEVSGLLPLTPIQEYFFGGDTTDLHHYNHSIMLDHPAKLDRDILHNAFTRLIQHHDALRIVFEQEQGAWLQKNRPFDLGIEIDYFDYSALSQEAGITESHIAANELQRDLKLDSRLLKVGLFHLVSGSKLVIICHHLIIDGISWRVILEDLAGLYESEVNGLPFALQPKTESFLAWSNKLSAAADMLPESEKKYWQRVESAAVKMPAVTPVHGNLEKNKKTLSLELGREISETILGEMHGSFGTSINDILITALSLAWVRVFKKPGLTLAMESHGRGVLFNDFDTTRTVGWFTSLYPVTLRVNTGRPIEDNIRLVRNTLKAVPNLGIGYGLLGYLSETPEGQSANFREKYPVLFNYFGQFDNNREVSGFEIDRDYAAEFISPSRKRDHQLEIIGIQLKGTIHLTAYYNAELFDTPDMEALLTSIRQYLGQISEACRSLDRKTVLRENLTYNKIIPAKFTELNRKRSVQDIYPLSPLQKGIYFHHKLNPSSQTYFQQVSYSIKGPFDIDLADQSLKMLFARHELLRSCISDELSEVPVQVVFKEHEPAIIYKKYDSQGGQSIKEFIEACKISDREKLFDLEKDLLLRVTVLELGTEHYELIWSNHHILMDGWCVGILSSEFMSFYKTLEEGTMAVLPEVFEYKDYINWQQHQSEKALREYWRTLLYDVKRATYVPVWYNNKRKKEGYLLGSWHFSVNEDITAKLVRLSQNNRVTLNIVLQAAWSILLSKYNHSDDVVFGAVVSGRPPELENIDHAIGLFINTIPVRARTKNRTLPDLFRDLQDQGVSGRPYHHGQLAELQGLTPVGGDLVNHIFLFENFPLAKKIKTIGEISNGAIEFTDVRVFDQTNYDFNIIVLPGNEIDIEFTYNRHVYYDDQVKAMASHLLFVLGQMTVDPGAEISNIKIGSETEMDQVLKEFNQTEAELPAGNILDLISHHVTAHPDRPAVTNGSGYLTYSQLWSLSRRLAYALKNKYNLSPQDVIAIKLRRSESLVATILSVMHLNCIYLPVDPDYPQERINYVIENSRCRLLIDEAMLTRLLDYASGEYVSPSFLPESLAYIIYTSGSTGKPKGVKVTHQNLLNFSVGMSKALPLAENDHILAVTSVSFDISFLELIWPLTKGMTLTLKRDQGQLTGFNEFLAEESKEYLDFSLFFFASYTHNSSGSKYRMLLESAKHADQNGYSAIWTPERHFHDFGGLYADPAITSAALSQITSKIELRSGSCVLPLHDTVRVAEQWSMIDNLSNGRVALALTSGWHANDFIFYPERYEKRRTSFFEQIEELRHLWRGGEISRKNGAGTTINIKIFPEPVRTHLPVWITAAGNPETFREAGKRGFNILTHLLGQSIDMLRANLEIFFKALSDNGHDKTKVKVALMVHTYIGNDITEVKEIVKEPFKQYLNSSLGLLSDLAKGLNKDISGEKYEEYREELLEAGFERYWNTAALLGTRESCNPLIKTIASVGVTELACLIDFGVPEDFVLAGLKNLDQLKEDFRGYKKDLTKKRAMPEISTLQTTPSLLGILLNDQDSRAFLKSLSTIIIGGESLPSSLYFKLRELTKAAIYNVYGPTETTIWSTAGSLDGDYISAGRPIANTQIYVLDKSLMPLAIGMEGEIYIGGKGVASGYFEMQDLSDEKFVELSIQGRKRRLYRTGDFGFWLPGGELHISGRTDSQVKLNGIRIELEEIEYYLKACPGVSDAAVIIDKPGTGDVLAAFIVSYTSTDHSLIRAELSRHLPMGWIPTLFKTIERIPLTPNGKTDRLALNVILRNTAVSAPGSGFNPPANKIEETLCGIWLTVMNRSGPLDVEQNLFEIGANSIVATQVNYKIHRELFVKLKLKDLFENPSIRQQASVILKSETSVYKKIERVPDAPHYPVSHAQRRMWLLNQLPAQQLNLIEPVIFRYRKRFDKEIFDEAANLVIQRHEILRTSVFLEGKTLVQALRPMGNDVFCSEYITNTANSAQEDDWQWYIKKALNTPFNLAGDILFRVSVVCLGKDDHLFIITNHHIISDDWSKNILVSELFEFYHAILAGKIPAREPLRIHYRDFTTWQNNYLRSGEAELHRTFWLQKFKTAPPAINLSVRGTLRKDLELVSAREYNFDIESGLMNDISALSNRISGTPFMVVMSSLKLLMYSISNETDIVVGTPAAGRIHPDLEQQIGFYLNLLPVRTLIDPHASAETYLLDEKENLLATQEHQFFPFDKLVEELEYKTELKRHPLFDVGLTYHNLNHFGEDAFKEYEAVDLESHSSATDLWLHVKPESQRLTCKIIYKTDLFSQSQIEIFKDQFCYILKRLTESKDLTPYHLKEEIGLMGSSKLKENRKNRLKKLKPDFSKTTEI